MSPFDFACVEVNDGVTHPSDGGSSGVVGYLRYEPERCLPSKREAKIFKRPRRCQSRLLHRPGL
ncbi:hypothetical protein SEEPBA42_14845 [Salmonella enterica subsp. enterica serovar Paratyphi B str. SARA42]|nr:hypothetical protein SEEPBA42_14845 [Salmonella enterica subsp. enterica serovar Paratyphi B str. SARA42]